MGDSHFLFSPDSPLDRLMRIFLTGGTGYIGRSLARRLVESGHEVRALVRATSNVEPLKQLGDRHLRG